MVNYQGRKLYQEINHGFIPDEIRPEDYVFGGHTKLKGEVLQQDGSWLAFLPPDERQMRFGVETMSCVSFSTLNALEILMHRFYQEIENYSDRYLAISSSTSPFGNSPHNVAETLRKESGCVDEGLLPFTEEIESFEEYHSPNPLPDDLLKKGKKWLKEFDFGHEWVFSKETYLPEKQEKLKEALKCSPIGISVYAWLRDEDGLYFKPKGVKDNHYCVLVDYEDGKYWIVLDTYPSSEGEFLKKLAWDYDFQYAKKYHIKKKKVRQGLFRRIWEAIKRFLNNIFE